MQQRDVIEQLVRCYTVIPKKKSRTERPATVLRPRTSNEVKKSDEERGLEEIARPWGGWCLVIAGEPTSGNARARIGAYARYGTKSKQRIRLYQRGERTRHELGMDNLAEAGVWYDPDLLSPEEIAAVQRYAATRDLECWTRAAFVRDVLYQWGYDYGALVIGHGLVSQLAALCQPGHWEVITTPQNAFRNGFRIGLCDCATFPCTDHPPIRTKHMGTNKDRVAFAPPKHEASRAGRFLDTVTFGAALRGGGDTSLRAMGERFGAGVVAAPDEPGSTHVGQVQAIDVALPDGLIDRVRATWALYQGERDLYRLYNVSWDMWRVASAAGLGKGMLQALGAPRRYRKGMLLRQEGAVPPEVLGYAMVALYAGRCEVGRRLVPTECVYADFRSQYPTCQALLGTQDLWLASRFDVRACTEETRAWLRSVMLDDLREPRTWRRWLRRLVKIRPRDDVLPVRGDYGPDRATTGLHVVKEGSPPAWWTLADAVNSRLKTGRAPEVLEAIEVVPLNRVETRPYAVLGDPRYVIDPAHDDVFTRLIIVRSHMKDERDWHAAHSPEWLRLDGVQQGLKELAVSTSYGIFAEISVAEPTKNPRPLCVYGLDTRTVPTRLIERPGDYFLAPVAAFITGAGRLLLGLAERLATDRGIGYAYMDTDALKFARPTGDRLSAGGLQPPTGMDRATFRRHVADICAWFDALSPYGDGKPLLEVEDENYAVGPDGALHKGLLETLHCIAVCDKRYILYNRLPDGSYRIRKFSAHGIGTAQDPAGYMAPAHVPEPWTDVADLANGTGERWEYDLWYDFITAVEGGTTQHLVATGNAWLDRPAVYHVTVSTDKVAEKYHDVPGLRPYGTVTGLPPLDRADIWRRDPARLGLARGTVAAAHAATYDALAGKPLYAPAAASVDDLGRVRYLDDEGTSHAVPAGVRYLTLAERLERHFVQRVWKAATPDGIGALPGRHVRVGWLRCIGKETNQAVEDLAEETDGSLAGVAAWAAQRFATVGVADVLKGYRMAELQAATGLPRQTLYDAKNPESGKSGEGPEPATLQRIRRGLTLLEAAPSGTFLGWQQIPRDWLADQSGLVTTEIDAIRRGERDVPDGFLEPLITAVQAWPAEAKRRRDPRAGRDKRRALRRAVCARGRVAPRRNKDGTCSPWPFSVWLQSATGKNITWIMQQTRYLHGCTTVAEFTQLLSDSSGKD